MNERAQHDTAPARALLDAGDPAQDARAFRRCLGQYPTGVTVITAAHEGRLVGMAVNSFAAVSLDPPLVLWSIRRESRSLQDFLAASHFAVNILAEDQAAVSQRFGAGDPDRFERTPWLAGAGGAPLLQGCLAQLECRLSARHEGGDHWILIGHVERYARHEGKPLLFSQGQYAQARPHPHLESQGLSAGTTPATGLGPEPFLKVLSDTQSRMSALFEGHRQSLGVTLASTRVLTRLYAGAAGLAELEQATYLGRHALEDALAEVCAQGLAQADGGRYQLTEDGRRKREAVAQRSAQFTAEQLQGVSASDVASAERVLRRLLQA